MAVRKYSYSGLINLPTDGAFGKSRQGMIVGIHEAGTNSYFVRLNPLKKDGTLSQSQGYIEKLWDSFAIEAANKYLLAQKARDL